MASSLPLARRFTSKLCNDRFFTLKTGTPGVSPVVDLFGTAIIGLIIPEGCVSSEIDYYSSPDGSEPPLQMFSDSGIALQSTIGANRIVMINHFDLAGVRYMAVLHNEVEASDRTIRLFTYPVT